MNPVLRNVFSNAYKREMEIESDNTCCQTPDAQALLSIIYFAESHGFRIRPESNEYRINYINGKLHSIDVAVDLWNEFTRAIKSSDEILPLKPQFQVYLSKLKHIAREIESPLSLEEKMIAAAQYKFYKENFISNNEVDCMEIYGLYMDPSNNIKDDYAFATKFYEKYLKLEEEHNSQPGNN